MAAAVVGIPTLVATDQQLGGAAGGIGFAISSDIVTDVAHQLVTYGKVIRSHRAALGIQVNGTANSSGQNNGAGIIAVTPGGAAARAGLITGDIIVSVNGTPIVSTEELSTVLANLEPGTTVPVKVTTTAGTTKSVPVILGALSG